MSTTMPVNAETWYSQYEQPSWENRPFGPSFSGFPKEEVEGSLVDRFEKQVVLYPERLAVKYGDHCFTYAELNKEANRLANLILESRDGVEEPVAFMVDNRALQVVALLGILKAGKMYLPLDSSFPKARIAYLLEDSQAPVLVTDDANLALVKEYNLKNVHVLNIDRMGDVSSVENPRVPISPGTIANLLYTSGSTGKSKGVIQDHRNLLHSIWAMTHSSKIGPSDRIALLYSLSFAASTNSLFGALLNGAALLPFDLKNGLAHLLEWLIQEKISIYSSVPTLFRHFAATLNGDEKFADLRLVTIGGEKVLQSDVNLFRKYFPKNCWLRVGYASTEMLTISWFYLNSKTPFCENVVPAGFIIEDKEIHIFDESGNPVREGEVGEIVVRSRYLSPGYWRRPELTAEKFEEDASANGMRWYRTGDLGRLSPSGCLYHMGRKDFQVKIRGFRVELEEIEAVLMQHPGIEEAAVKVDEGKGGEKRLVAYVVPGKRRTGPSREELRLYMKKNLPDYMLPSATVTLDALPLTASGKVNRMGLPDLADVFDLEKDYIPPRDMVEKKLVQVWEELLEVSPIGVRNNFFRLGGHSLLAASLIGQMETVFGKRIDMATLAGEPTIEKLAEALRKEKGKGNERLVLLQPGSKRPGFYCVHGVGGHILPFLALSEHLGDERPVYGLQAKGLDGTQTPERDLAAMVHSYLKEIRRVQPVGPYYLGGFSFGGYVVYEMARLLESQGEQVGILAIFDTQAGRLAGFKKSLSKDEWLRYKIKSVAKKYSYHLKEMLAQPKGMRLRYLRHRPERSTVEEAIMGDMDEGDYEVVPEYLQAVMKANREALREYVPGKFNGKICLFKSYEDGRGVYYGWEELAAGGVETYEVPGNHRGILQVPNVRVLAGYLKFCIQESEKN
jgi:amino acid adenylation domain-containing protein